MPDFDLTIYPCGYERRQEFIGQEPPSVNLTSFVVGNAVQIRLIGYVSPDFMAELQGRLIECAKSLCTEQNEAAAKDFYHF